MTNKAALRGIGPAVAREIEALLPSDVAFVLLLGVKGSGEQICVSNIPADVTRAWLANSSDMSADVRTIR